MKTFASLLVGLAIAAPLSAATIYSNLAGSPGGPGWFIGAPLTGGPSVEFAASFVADDNYTLTKLTAAVDSWGIAKVYIAITEDLLGAPGTELESLLLSDSGSAAFESALSVKKPTLTKGSIYWIALRVEGSTSGGWSHTNPVQYGAVAMRRWGPSWNVQNSQLPQFAVEGELAGVETPEPSSFGLATLGLLILGGRLKGRYLS